MRWTKAVILTWVLLLLAIPCFAQHKQQPLEFSGQLSVLSSYSPDNELDLFAGGRYLPELSYGFNLTPHKMIDFEASLNLSGTAFYHPFDTLNTNATLDPYRLWVRYTGSQTEIRGGLQKIDFGVAMLLRPLQWFNQIDPRDPLQLTNGVYGVLGRHYFLNNANVWLWALYGNEARRGFDAVSTFDQIPEFGGRFQFPTTNGEMAFSYHHRVANSENLIGFPNIERIPENRFGLDGKWDLGIGLWFEASHVFKNKEIADLTNQTLITVGADYTFGVGNGLNIVAEHLYSMADENAFTFNNTSHISAINLAYPLTLWDNLNLFSYYNWPTNDATFFVNYEHQFKKVIGYIMAFYNPSSQQGIQENNLVNNFTGPGFRLMLVYNY